VLACSYFLANFLMGGSICLGGKSKERGGNLSLYDVIRGRFKLSFSLRRRKIDKAQFKQIDISNH